MFSPNKWIKPRLKPLCVGFGLADMTLVLLSIFSWYFFFSISHLAQNNELIKIHGRNKESFVGPPVETSKDDNLKLAKEDRDTGTLRLQRTLRACGPFLKTENTAGPAALIGASMGGYFILGALLASISFVHYPAARKALCTVALIGEGISTLFLMTAVTLIAANDGLCPTEYYFEHVQPIVFLVVFSILFITTYKTYEVTVIIFYRMEMAKRINENENRAALRRNTLSGPGPETEEQMEAEPEQVPNQQAERRNSRKDKMQERRKKKTRRRKLSNATREVTGVKNGKPFTVQVRLE